MARPSIENIKSLGDFATSLNWNVAMAVWPKNLESTIDTDDFNFRCRSITAPSMSSQPVSVTIRGHTVHQPGTYTPSGIIEFQLVETIDNKVSNMLKAWRDLCWSPIYGIQATKQDVQATLYLERLDRQDNVIWQYFIYGAFLLEFDPTGGPLGDGMQQEVLAPTIRLSYDYFIDTAQTSPNASDSDATTSTNVTPTFSNTSQVI